MTARRLTGGQVDGLLAVVLVAVLVGGSISAGDFEPGRASTGLLITRIELLEIPSPGDADGPRLPDVDRRVEILYGVVGWQTGEETVGHLVFPLWSPVVCFGTPNAELELPLVDPQLAGCMAEEPLCDDWECGRFSCMFIPPDPGAWTWNGSLESPTLSPSVLVPAHPGSGIVRCHSFVKDGRIRFLGDCEHGLAGTTVALPGID